ncbi:MAG: helicase-associated domain-containing protein [Candidatus Brocadiae bacterium]|nr:helicase-associated domain-containing protein [Candidatus Brocadiia bacterium]
MQLDESLNARSIASLQTIQFVWAPTTRRSASKSELLRLLRRHMLSPERVRDLYQALSPAEQEVIGCLLRSEGYHADVTLCNRRLSVLGHAPSARNDAVQNLGRSGWVYSITTGTALGRSVQSVLLTQELGDLLCDVLNLDIRDPASMLGLAHATHTDGNAAAVPVSEHGTAGDYQSRIDRLPDEALRRAVRLALERSAGILPLERFPSLGLEIEPVDHAQWRRLLEEHRLGTFGHLDLEPFHLGDDHECLVVYQEIVQAHAAALAGSVETVDHTYACDVDFLCDLTTVVDFIRANPSKLTSTGRLFRGARNQLLPRTACHTTFFMDEESLLACKLRVARRLHLLETRGDDRLHATREAAAWQARPLVEQMRSVLDALLAVAASAVPGHFARLASIAAEQLLELRPAQWMPTDAFVSRVISLHLCHLLAHPEEALPAESEEPAEPWGGYWRKRPTIEDMFKATTEPLLRSLNYAGLLDIGRADGRTFLRRTELVPFVLGNATMPSPAAHRLLIVNPDGEVVLFPEEHHGVVLHRLASFCDREKSEVTLHLRICQDSVQRAALRGMDAESILDVLRDNCRVPLAQNIEYSVRSWAGSVHPAAIETLHVLEFPSAELLDAALQLPEIIPLVVRRISPTALALNVSSLGPEAQDALTQLGVYLT